MAKVPGTTSITDLLKPVSGLADDALMMGSRAYKAGPSGVGKTGVIPDANDSDITQRIAERSGALMVAGIMPDSEREKPNRLDAAVNMIASVAGTIGFIPIIGDIGSFVGTGVSKIPGGKTLGKILQAPQEHVFGKQANLGISNSKIVAAHNAQHADTNKHIGKLGSDLFHASMVVEAGVATYHLARGFSEKMEALKQMYGDMTGQNPKTITTMSMLTRPVPGIIGEQRKHIMIEHGLRLPVTLFGMGASWSGMRKGVFPFLSGFAGPMAANFGIDFMMGEAPILDVYKGISDAYKRGLPLTQQNYADFLIASSQALKSRGYIGKQVALEVAKQYVEEKASPVQILKEIEESQGNKSLNKNTKFDLRIGDILAKAEAEQAVKVAARKATPNANTTKNNHSTITHSDDATQRADSMVDKIKGKSLRNVEVKGVHTQRLQKEMSSPEQGVSPSVA